MLYASSAVPVSAVAAAADVLLLLLLLLLLFLLLLLPLPLLLHYCRSCSVLFFFQKARMDLEQNSRKRSGYDYQNMTKVCRL